nr:MATE family efflux transporter [Jannaschia sp. Os4]
MRIAAPIVLSNATIPLLGLVDAGTVGQLGEAAPVAAVGVGAAMLTAAYWLFGFLRMGTTGLAAQALGQGDGPELVALLTRALLIGGVAGLAMIAFQGPLIAAALALTPDLPETKRLAADYMAIRVWSAPALIAGYGVTGWLIAQERTGRVLILQLAMNGTNIVLNLWFVLGLGLGVPGVAWSTFAAEWLGLGLGLWLCRDAFATPAWRDRARVLHAPTLRRMATVNAHILIRSALLLVAFRAFLLTGGRFGEAQLAANHVLMLFLEVIAYVLDGFAFAAEALVGQAVGAASRDRLRRAVRLTGLWGAGMVVLLSAAFAAGGGPAIDLLVADPGTRAAAKAHLPWLVAAPVVGVASYMLDGIFIGATRTKDMAAMMGVAFAIYLAALALLVSAFGNHGLWAALLVFLAARGATLAWRYPALERDVTPRRS